MLTITTARSLALCAFVAVANHAYGLETRIISYPSGHQETWVYEQQLARDLLVSRTSQADGKAETRSYDAQNNLISIIDWEGKETRYTYNNENQRTSKTDAYGTPEARTTSYEYLSRI